MHFHGGLSTVDHGLHKLKPAPTLRMFRQFIHQIPIEVGNYKTILKKIGIIAK